MHDFLFGIYPYIALTVLRVGSVARYERDPFTWKSSSSQLLRRRQLVIGSVLFGAGWGLAGLCPGPSVASLSYGGTGGMIFLAAMLAGMMIAPPLKARLDSAVPAE